jgi:hypothetical protein
MIAVLVSNVYTQSDQGGGRYKPLAILEACGTIVHQAHPRIRVTILWQRAVVAARIVILSAVG